MIDVLAAAAPVALIVAAAGTLIAIGGLIAEALHRKGKNS